MIIYYFIDFYVKVSLEKEVDMIRVQQGKMRDFLVQVRINC